MEVNEINQRIEHLPSSMLEAEDIESAVREASMILHMYQKMSSEDQEQVRINKVTDLLSGNSDSLNTSHIKEKSNRLKGKTIGYLGSSITVGMKSENTAFPDFIGRLTGSHTVKQAISGGTLACKKSDAQHDYREKISYITQLMDPAGVLQRTEHLDLLVVQLSTNDGTMEIDLGSVNKEKDLESFDVSTSAGAMEYIIAYAEKKWHCPVMFYVNPYIHPEEYEMLDQKKQEEIYQGLVVKYEKLIALLYQIQEKWPIGVIDLWNEASFRSISMELKRYYMADIIHPYKSGYLFWYTPFICQKMEEMITA